MLRTDEAIGREVISQVVERYLWSDAAQVRVGVKDGVVTLSGIVERKSQIPIVVTLTSTIDGVVGVVDELCYARNAT